MINLDIDIRRHDAQSREAPLISSRLIIAAAALAAMTLLSSAAQACISCNYTPSYGDSGAKAAPARREHSYTRTEERRRAHTAKKRSIEREDT